MANASSSSRSVTSFFRPPASQIPFKQSTFVVEHNLAFKASDHATKFLFQVAKKNCFVVGP